MSDLESTGFITPPDSIAAVDVYDSNEYKA